MTLPRCFLTSALLALNLACVSKTQVVETPAPPPPSRDAAPVRWITLSDLERSLPPAPISVVFDVDDTALFTSAGFQWGTKTYGAHIVSAGVSVREEDLPSEEDRREYREFWTRMNNELDQYSVKKWIAGELIALHKRRGDQIHFVTKRIFTSRQAKTEAFRRINAVLSYGDSDGDIRETIATGARPIRVMRARTSVNADPVHNGSFGEEVLVNSEF